MKTLACIDCKEPFEAKRKDTLRCSVQEEYNYWTLRAEVKSLKKSGRLRC